MIQKISMLSLVVVLSLLTNRASAQKDESASPAGSPLYVHQQFAVPDSDEKIDYWLLSPAKIEPGKKYPLVLALHGRGGNTTAAGVLAKDDLREKYPCFVLAPTTTRQGTWALPPNANRLNGRPKLPAALLVVEMLKKEKPIDADRVYVTGQSMGGFGTFGAVAASPQTFAAAVPVCGGWTTDDAAKMKDVPLWAFHGDKDTTVPVERSRDMIEAIKKAGGAPKLTEFPGVGHPSWVPAYDSAETWAWLFAQKREQK